MKKLKKMRFLKTLSILLTNIVLILPLQVRAQAIKSLSDVRLPENIRQSILAYKFEMDNKTLTGSSNTNSTTRGNRSVNIEYKYKFELENNNLVGKVTITTTVAGLEPKSSDLDFAVHKVYKCCKDAHGKEGDCYDPDDEKGIAAATNNGCIIWYKKVVQ